MESFSMKLLSEFLTKNARQDLKLIALKEVLGLSGSQDGCTSIEQDKEIGRLLVESLPDKHPEISKNACLCLVNISASDDGVNYLMNAFSGDNKEIIIQLLKHALSPDSDAADAALMTLSNLTRQSCVATIVVEHLNKANVKIDDLINAFTKINYNSIGCNLNYLASLFSNLSQNCEFRRQILNKNKCFIQKLLPFTQFQASSIRKYGIVATLRNCCFETDYHEWLLGSEVDILPHLLLPLAGPEEFSEEENEKLPLDLQYLGEDKERESDADIRKMLLEAILQLCTTSYGREYMRSKNVYYILREYHKWEKNRSVLLACENVIDLLIRTEEEINEDNIKNVEVPDIYFDKFEEMDKNYIQDD